MLNLHLQVGVVSIFGSDGYKVEAHHKKQPNNTKQGLYKPLI